MCADFNQTARIYANSGCEIFPDCKTGPYISPRGVAEVVNFNREIEVNGQVIFCTHLSALFMFNGVDCYTKGKRIKVNSLFASKDSIIKSAPPNVENLYKNILERSCGRHIIPCNNFGNFLYKISIRMNPNEQRFFLIDSSIHSMSFMISRKIREYPEFIKNTWVVNFFDPNRTNITSRSEVSAPRDFLNSDVFSLNMFINNNFYESYFFYTNEDNKSEAENECVVYEYSDKAEANFKFSTLSALSQYNVSACMIYHIMFDEYASFCLTDITKRISSCINKETRKKLFFAKNSRGAPALYAAMEQGKSQSVKAYDYLLQALSRDEQISLLPELLSSKIYTGTPALFIAMQKGHVECISSYATLLECQLNLMKDMLPEDSFVDIVVNLLSGKRNNEISALFVGLNKNNADAVGAYAKVLDKVFLLKGTIPDDRLADIIFNLICSPLPCNGETTLFLALNKGYASSICAIGLLIDKLIIMKGCISHDKLAEMIYKLLSSTDKHGTFGLFTSLREGNSRAVLSFGCLIDKLLAMRGCISDEKLATMVFNLLMAKSGDGVPGLSIAMENGLCGTIRAFGKLLEKITVFKDAMDNNPFNNMLLEIVISRRSDGTSGLFIALDSNLPNVIDCYSSLLTVIPEDKLVDVLVALNSHGVPGALVAGKEALDAYLSIISSLSSYGVIQNLYSEFKCIRKSIAHIFLGDSNFCLRYKLLLDRIKKIKSGFYGTTCNARCLY
ncbi:ShET2/EspL2 family type III secretion system effector toxin [Candidatus Ichthyocystis sparus]|uniref:ShET2/EspL2 family type III secretion system effector toxin n=3 Tax=Candidatus Ichthyocystis sparus TaxID=1561004 RepID=UPI000B88DD6A|nr:ShET2/EspL2 family type III secretion system effector toxin [Candidatus Ichthyocystis sparus]